MFERRSLSLVRDPPRPFWAAKKKPGSVKECLLALPVRAAEKGARVRVCLRAYIFSRRNFSLWRKFCTVVHQCRNDSLQLCRKRKVQIQIAIPCLVCYDIFKLERIGHFFSIFTIESLLLYLLDLDHLVQVYIHKAKPWTRWTVL